MTKDQLIKELTMCCARFMELCDGNYPTQRELILNLCETFDEELDGGIEDFEEDASMPYPEVTQSAVDILNEVGALDEIPEQ